MLRSKEVKSVLNKLKKRDSWFPVNYTVNPYEGCSCNCQYCYIRGSKYGENLADGLVVKANAAAILDKQLALRAKKGEYGFIALGSATDAYIHHEQQEQATLRLLEVIARHRFPVFISTKCTGILRDTALLKEIDRNAILPQDLATTLNRGVILSVSLSAMNEKIAATLEPGAAPPADRLTLLRQLKQEGFIAGVNAMPLLPFISDTEEELEKMIRHCKLNDADFLLVAGLTLFGDAPGDSKTLYFKFLERYDDSLTEPVKKLFGNQFYQSHTYQQALKERASRLCKKYDIRTSLLP